MALHTKSSTIDRAGTVTDSRIEAGSYVYTMTGELITLPTLISRLFTHKVRTLDDVLMLRGYFRFLLPDSVSMAINHSCSPSCGFRNERDLYAIRTIEPGEEITFDYSLTVKGTIPWIMSCLCRCGAPNCRGSIGNIATVPVETYGKYLELGVVPRHFQLSRRLRIGGMRLGLHVRHHHAPWGREQLRLHRVPSAVARAVRKAGAGLWSTWWVWLVAVCEDVGASQLVSDLAALVGECEVLLSLGLG